MARVNTLMLAAQIKSRFRLTFLFLVVARPASSFFLFVSFRLSRSLAAAVAPALRRRLRQRGAARRAEVCVKFIQSGCYCSSSSMMMMMMIMMKELVGLSCRFRRGAIRCAPRDLLANERRGCRLLAATAARSRHIGLAKFACLPADLFGGPLAVCVSVRADTEHGGLMIAIVIIIERQCHAAGSWKGHWASRPAAAAATAGQRQSSFELCFEGFRPASCSGQVADSSAGEKTRTCCWRAQVELARRSRLESSACYRPMAITITIIIKIIIIIIIMMTIMTGRRSGFTSGRH
jgi:hypothetical protein